MNGISGRAGPPPFCDVTGSEPGAGTEPNRPAPVPNAPLQRGSAPAPGTDAEPTAGVLGALLLAGALRFDPDMQRILQLIEDRRQIGDGHKAPGRPAGRAGKTPKVACIRRSLIRVVMK